MSCRLCSVIFLCNLRSTLWRVHVGQTGYLEIASPNNAYGPEGAGPMPIMSKQVEDKTRREENELCKRRENIVSFPSAIKAYGRKSWVRMLFIEFVPYVHFSLVGPPRKAP